MLKEFQEDEKSWDEKDFEGDIVAVVDEEGNTTYVLENVETTRKKKTPVISKHITISESKDYPIDIWFLIADYIRPEDVGRFACICKTSLEVVSTAKFWFRLYRKYYKSTSSLPEELQPERLVRKYGLRTAVIRALYHMYPLFVCRLTSPSTKLAEGHPDVLVKRRCISMWYIKKNRRWCYYFKLRENVSNPSRNFRKADMKRPDLLKMLDDITANPDDHCRILQITCEHFIQVPLVIGL